MGRSASVAIAATLLLAACRVSDQPPPRVDEARDSSAVVAAVRDTTPADTATDPMSRARRLLPGRKVHRAVALTPVWTDLPPPIAAVVELGDTFRVDPGDSLTIVSPALEVVVLRPAAWGWRAARTGLRPYNTLDNALHAEIRGEPVPSWARPSNTVAECFGMEDADGDGDLEVWTATNEAGARSFLITIDVYDVESGATYSVQMQSGQEMDVRPSYAEYSAGADPATRRWLWRKVESVAESIYRFDT